MEVKKLIIFLSFSYYSFEDTKLILIRGDTSTDVAMQNVNLLSCFKPTHPHPQWKRQSLESEISKQEKCVMFDLQQITHKTLSAAAGKLR